MLIHLSPPTSALVALTCAAFATLFYFLGRFAERDAVKRVAREAARKEALQLAADRRDFRAIYGDADWFASAMSLEKRRGVQRVRLPGRRVA